MKGKFSIKKYLSLILLGIFLGGVIGAIAGSFMYAQHYLIEFLWELIPHKLGGSSPVYIIIICSFGGLIVGIARKYLGDNPQPMHVVMKKIKSGNDLPGINTVPSGFLLSLISLGFGAALGPEAALIGIAVGFSTWFSQIMAKFTQKVNLKELEKPWSKIPGYLAIASGFAIFAVVSVRMFNLDYATIPYKFSFSFSDVLAPVMFGVVGLLLGKSFTWFGSKMDDLFTPLKKNHVAVGLMGGLILGIFGTFSPLILFSGQVGLGSLYEHGLEMGGIFLILIGLLKMMATKINTSTGWKGGEIFPAMFSSAAIGMGVTNLIPGIHPMVGIAATMAATTTIVLNNIYISLAVMLIFLPANLALPMAIASLVALLGTKKIFIRPIFKTEKIPIIRKNR